VAAGRSAHHQLWRLASAQGTALAFGVFGAPRLARPTVQALANFIAQLLELGGAQASGSIKQALHHDIKPQVPAGHVALARDYATPS
jgi:hypothetical protein